MSKDPTYPMYAQDFDMDTSYWTNEEIGAYIRLLNACWANNGLPTEHDKLARIVRLHQTDFLKLWNETIKHKFFEKNGNFFNKKQEEVRKYRFQQKTNGSKGGAPKGNSNALKKQPKNNRKTTEKQPKNKLSNEVEVEIEVEIDFEKLKLMFNTTCTQLKNILTINKIRKEKIYFLINEYKPSDVYVFFQAVFDKVKISNFLNGGGKNGFLMTFDWMLNPENFLKIIEDNYKDEKSNNNSKTRKLYSDDFKRKIAQGLQS